ncbi:MAG: 5-dehydro-2-deoxygluconokinase [Clostridia bacterium]|nr:5-dehydro-2-deoxygluconokinase [Clostridia bacterium]
MGYVTFPENKDFDIIPLGRVAVDFNPTDMNRPLSESSNFNKYVGGSPANIAVGMARLGKKVGFIGKVSDDQFGDYVTDYFRNDGIDVSHITRCKNGEKIGLTFTEIKSPTESSILMYREGVADLMLSPEDVDEDYIKRTKCLLISGTALCRSPSREAALKAMMLAEKNGIPIIFDIDYRAYTWKSPDEISVYYSMVAEHADIILGSREEYDLTERITSVCSSDKESAERLFACKAKIVVIKHGKEGSTAYTNDGKSYAVKPFPVKAMKGFGGGDGYASSFIRALIDGAEMYEALEYGSASAAMLVSAHSCSAAMPSLEAVTKFIADEKAEYGEMVARG